MRAYAVSPPSQSCFGPRPHSVLLRVRESDFHALETKYGNCSACFHNTQELQCLPLLMRAYGVSPPRQSCFGPRPHSVLLR
eukprot:929418-Karenia_brevis.AAC.1